MFIDKKIEIIFNNSRTKKNIWLDKLGFIPKENEKILVYWELLKTTKYRTCKINLKCDMCENIHTRRIRDLDTLTEIHYCNKCSKKGERNSNYGKPMNENTKKGLDNWNKNNDNPFTWESTKRKIKECGVLDKLHENNKGKKRTIESKRKISESMVNSYLLGKSKPHSGWGNIKIRIYKNIEYQSKYELLFLQYVENLGLLDIIERGPKILYITNDNKKHVYFSDYKIKNTNHVIEIKSIYTWNKNIEVNLLKKEASEKLYNYILIMDNKFDDFYEILKNEKII